MNPITCLALGTLALPAAPSGDAVLDDLRTDRSCLATRLEAAGRWTTAGPDVALNPSLSLTRARLAMGVAQGPVSARVAMWEARSAPDQGYVGVAGEAFVPVLQIAEARLRLDSIGLGVAAGMVDDPWVVTANRAWGARALAPTLGEANGWLDRSDLGGLMGWTSPGRWVTASVALTTGEGANRRERNSGQNTTGVLTLRPLAFDDELAGMIEVQAMVRDGSRGQALAQDHRRGVRVSGFSDHGTVGIEWLATNGVGGDVQREPSGLSAWVNLEPRDVPAVGILRVDRVTQDPDNAESRQSQIWVAAGARLPQAKARRSPARLVAGWSQIRAGEDAATLAGADALQELSSFFIQLEVDARVDLEGL